MRDQGSSQHVPRVEVGLSGVARQLDATSLPAATCVNLRLHDDFATELLGRGPCLACGSRDDAARGRDPVGAQNLFRLEFVDLHRGKPVRYDQESVDRKVGSKPHYIGNRDPVSIATSCRLSERHCIGPSPAVT